MRALVSLASVLAIPLRALRPMGHPLALLLALWGALSLVACGGGGGGVLPGGGLSGYVFEGEGTDGNFSGRPLSGVQVRYESGSEVVTVTTDASGFFATGRNPSGPYTLHVIPPTSAQAASQSVYGMTLAETGPVVRFYLPLRRPAGGPSRWTGNSPTSSVVGILRDQTGSPQPGSVPAGGSPGDPGTVGFVWWGIYRAQSPSCPRCYSTVAASDGTFDIQSLLGGQALGRTFPFFAGNYDGLTFDGAIAFYSQYVFYPKVDALSSGPTDLGPVVMGPTAGLLPVTYDNSTATLANGYGSGGLVYTFVQMYVSITSDPLELAEAANGPFVYGSTLPAQSVPVPQIPETAESRYFLGRSFALDANAPPTAEIALTTAFRVAGSPLRIGHLTPARSLQAGSGPRRTFAWTPGPGATVQVVVVQDASELEVWRGILRGDAATAAMPFDLSPGSYGVFVYSNDLDRPADWVTGQPSVGRRAGLEGLRRARPAMVPRQALVTSLRPLRMALRQVRPLLGKTPFANNMVREALSSLRPFSVP